jgi:hypothetical protein
MGHRMDRLVRFVSHHHHLVQLYVVVVVLHGYPRFASIPLYPETNP